MTANLDFLNTKVRGVVYAVAVVAGVLAEAATKGYTAIGHGLPVWLLFLNGALPTLLVAAGAVAASHLSNKVVAAAPAGGEAPDFSDFAAAGEEVDPESEGFGDLEPAEQPTWGVPDEPENAGEPVLPEGDDAAPAPDQVDQFEDDRP